MRVSAAANAIAVRYAAIFRMRLELWRFMTTPCVIWPTPPKATRTCGATK